MRERDQRAIYQSRKIVLLSLIGALCFVVIGVGVVFFVRSCACSEAREELFKWQRGEAWLKIQLWENSYQHDIFQKHNLVMPTGSSIEEVLAKLGKENLPQEISHIVFHYLPLAKKEVMKAKEALPSGCTSNFYR